MPRPAHESIDVLRAKHMGIDTYQEPVIYLAATSPVCRAEGWSAQSRIEVSRGERTVIATLSVTTGALVAPDEAGLSDAAWTELGADEGDFVRLAHAPPTDSFGGVRAKVYGRGLSAAELRPIVVDIARRRYSAIELAAFVTAFAGTHPSADEAAALTQAMVETGEQLHWGVPTVADKHCIGGLPGNRTSMIVVPIVAARGLMIPKTSSRAITSPAGTADAMEVIAPVCLDLPAMRRVVEREGACIVWGGGVHLAPADDIIISVERPLDFDSGTQLVASVLSKKVAAGSTHVIIDMPIGPTAKVRSSEAADALEELFKQVGSRMKLSLRVVRTNGTQPVGRGVGPALEARDVLSVLRRAPDAPSDLRDRAVMLAGAVLELAGAEASGAGQACATRILESGSALEKFTAICREQGGMREPRRAPFTHVIHAAGNGRLVSIDNRRLARVAKLAGAPHAATAGVELHATLDGHVVKGQPLLTIHAETQGEVDYASAYLRANPQVAAIKET